MILVVASNEDVASTNIAEKIIGLYGFAEKEETFQENSVYQKTICNSDIKLITIKSESINAQFITEVFVPRLLIFISRHSSQSGIPTLSVHTPGNLTDEAEKGGVSKHVSISPASAMKEAIREMVRQVEKKKLAYEVSYECTHHGPSLNIPTMFVELGSSPKQWLDADAAEAVAHAAIAAATNQTEYPTVIGIGGPHYNEKFTKIALTTSTAFGHMIPKYSIAKIDSDMLLQCVRKTVEKVESVLLDWKGVKGEDKEELIKTINAANLKAEKV